MKSNVPLVLAAVVSTVSIFGCTQESGAPVRPPESVASSTASAPSAPQARSDYADVRGARHYYQVRGDLQSGKTPLLILHGSFMSSEAMSPWAERFARTRPVIVVDARGHGRTPDIAGPMTYELLADDAAGVLAFLGVSKADVLGYSMGGLTAIALAVGHPDQVNKIVPVSAPYARQGWYPENLAGFEQWSPEMLAGTGLEAEYKRLSPTPDGLPALLVKHKAQEVAPYGWQDESIRNLRAPTMVVVGDADGVQLDHAVKFFNLRGGGDREAAAKGYLARAPRARLAVLPGTSHIGMAGRPQLIVDVVTPFLDDETPPLPADFLKPGPGKIPVDPPQKQ